MKGALVLTNIFGLGCQFVMFQSLRLRVSHTLQILVISFVSSSQPIRVDTDAAGEGAARYQRKLQNDAEDLDLSELPADVARTLRDWLVRSATCGMRYQWVKLAPVFWPRWLRHTDCEKSGGSRSCSFPSGMACRQAQTTQIKILAWHCVAGRKCLWRQVPYPVVTACKCSCK
uniref:Noggin n=1 Tax=Oncorhynchus kisutch TaxID=8019 RepID=A0A8C7JDE0_ONCKI